MKRTIFFRCYNQAFLMRVLMLMSLVNTSLLFFNCNNSFIFVLKYLEIQEIIT